MMPLVIEKGHSLKVFCLKIIPSLFQVIQTSFGVCFQTFPFFHSSLFQFLQFSLNGL